MRVLVLNPGSSSLKYQLLDLGSCIGRLVLVEGLVERVEGASTAQAASEVLAVCRGQSRVIDAVGCRVVHGGPRFSAPTRVTADVLREIRALSRLAPLHNPVAADVLEATLQLLPNVPVVAVFDTAFHRTLPEVAALYALPRDLADRLHLRRYGFHGTSHRYVAAELLSLLNRPAPGSRLITCHLGNGVSVCAVRDGRSVDTSMGLTPLEGLVMGTRSGDVDPGLLLHLLTTEGMSPAELDKLLNHQSGLLGLANHADMRDLQAAVDRGDERARLALDIFCYRLRKYIGAYAAALEGLDALAFSAGIGEHSPPVRSKVCNGLRWLGVQLDEQRNAQATGKEPARISADGSAVAVWVVPTNEELQIARETAALADVA